MVSNPCLYKIKVVTSVIYTDHKAIVAFVDSPPIDRNKRSTKTSYRKRSPDQHASLLRSLQDFAEDDTIAADPQAAWDSFYDDAKGRLDKFYPTRTVTISSRDSDYITPEIKFLLRQKTGL